MMFGNVRKGVKHVFAALLFCLIMSAALVCFADEKGTVTADSAKVREKADASSKQVGSAKKGTTVDIVSETTGADGKKWYEVSVDGNLKGYIRSDLIKKGEQAADGNANAAVTPTDAKSGTVTTNSVHVRKEPSTNGADLATVSKGIVLTVTGEAQGSDGKKWYQVTFKHNDKDVGGFIRADLVTFENVPADPAVSEITGTGGENGEMPPETQQPPETPETPQQEDNANNSGAGENEGIIFMNVEEEPYIMPGFEVVALDWNGQKINAYRNGTFFIVYAQKQNGEEGWYLLDREKNIYQRYPYAVENVTVPKAGMLSGNLVPMIVMAVVIVIMLVVIVVLILKLSRSGGYYEEDDEDDYPDEDDEDDIEDIGEEIARKPLLRRSSQPQNRQEQAGSQPVRHPSQPQNRQEPQSRLDSVGQSPVRRPLQPQSAHQDQTGQQSGQPVRRPLQPQNRQEPQEQSIRRPVQGQQDRPGQRRPSAQSGRPVPNAHPQRGKNASDKDDDMNFVDI